MKPDVKKIIADIKATKGNRKYCNGLAGTLQDDNYASSICKYVKTVTPERIDLLVEYAEKLEAEVTDMAVQLANAESKCRDLAAENAALKSFGDKLYSMYKGLETSGGGFHDEQSIPYQQAALDAAISAFEEIKTPATDDFLAEVRAQGVETAITVVNDCSNNICAGGLAENRQYEEAIVNPYLDGIHDELQEIAAQLRKGAAL
ncbi:hypothetical protein [Citrobacter portucalensis]|uniref:hypothetical protein n=1 Tax=Citrobacter portucalensis TaxID=1639133 RepID=UPI001E402CD6|nr:hypothetical protein [Citrobacter portucalensis]